jgi:energy-coupling factor transporter ATP-binding protein EcfA2
MESTPEPKQVASTNASTSEQSIFPRVSAAGKSDKPAKRDFLDRKIYATAIAALIYNANTEAPLTIGIYGPWGSGKSSFLTQLTDLLPKRYKVAAFNPWRLSGDGEVWAGLVNEIAPIIDRHLGPLQRIRFLWSRDSTRSVSKVYTRLAAASKKIGNWLTLAAAVLAAGSLQAVSLPTFLSNSWLGQQINAIPSWFGAYEFAKVPWNVVGGGAAMVVVVIIVLCKVIKTYFHPFSAQFKANLSQFKDDSRELKSTTFKDFEALRKVIGDFTTRQVQRHKPHLVLLIDDLDRCAPDRVVGVLEALNTFIAELPIVTVIAVDTEFICKAVAARHRFLFAPEDGPEVKERYGQLFLEKIIHIPFQLPAVRSYGRYVDELLTIIPGVRKDGQLDEDEENDGVPMPSVADLVEGQKGPRRIMLALVAAYFRYIFIAVVRDDTANKRWESSMRLRFLFGRDLTQLQQEWLPRLDYTDRIGLRIFQEEISSKGLLHTMFSYGFRVGRIATRQREELLSNALKIQESDRAILRGRMADLHGNPRSIKRFVNTYLLAQGINALVSVDQPVKLRLEDLAVWLVLLQNWPRHGGFLCGLARATAQAQKPFIPENWVEEITEKVPSEMIAFVQSKRGELERLAASGYGLDIARCFSFYTAES